MTTFIINTKHLVSTGCPKQYGCWDPEKQKSITPSIIIVCPLSLYLYVPFSDIDYRGRHCENLFRITNIHCYFYILCSKCLVKTKNLTLIISITYQNELLNAYRGFYMKYVNKAIHNQMFSSRQNTFSIKEKRIHLNRLFINRTSRVTS